MPLMNQSRGIGAENSGLGEVCLPNGCRGRVLLLVLCENTSLAPQDQYRGMVEITLENISDQVEDACDDIPGFECDLSVRNYRPIAP